METTICVLNNFSDLKESILYKETNLKLIAIWKNIYHKNLLRQLLCVSADVLLRSDQAGHGVVEMLWEGKLHSAARVVNVYQAFEKTCGQEYASKEDEKESCKEPHMDQTNENW